MNQTSCDYEVGSGKPINPMKSHLLEVCELFQVHLSDDTNKGIEITALPDLQAAKYGYYQYNTLSVTSKFNGMCHFEISFIRNDYHFRNSEVKLKETVNYVLYSACGGQALGIYSSLESLCKGLLIAYREAAKIACPPDGYTKD